SSIESPIENAKAMKTSLNLVDEVRETAHLREFTVKRRATRKYDSKVISREFKEGDLVLKRPMGRDKGGKQAPNWEGHFRINEKFTGGAYRLETLQGEFMPRTWNVANLRYYYS
ncbi:gag-pol polyprotein, partial [Trifolium medium]|nr:gag-pol polyprotein [Trifolium medium]